MNKHVQVSDEYYEFYADRRVEDLAVPGQQEEW